MIIYLEMINWSESPFQRETSPFHHSKIYKLICRGTHIFCFLSNSDRRYASPLIKDHSHSTQALGLFPSLLSKALLMHFFSFSLSCIFDFFPSFWITYSFQQIKKLWYLKYFEQANHSLPPYALPATTSFIHSFCRKT